MHDPLVRRGSAAGKDELSLIGALVDCEPHRIPERRYFLPFIDQTGLLAFKCQGGIYLGKLPILKIPGRVTDKESTLGMFLRSPGLSAPFGTLDAYCSKCPNVLLDCRVNNARSIDIVVHGSSPIRRVFQSVKFSNIIRLNYLILIGEIIFITSS